MNKDINLVIGQEKPKSGYNKVFLGTSVIFGLSFALAFLLTIYSFTLKAKLSSLTNDVISERGRISEVADTRQKILVTQERIEGARKVISKRSSLESRTSQILASLPTRFNIDSVKAEQDLITLRLVSGDLLAFDDLFETKLTPIARDQTLGVKRIESSSFTRSGNYDLTLDFYFSDAVKK